MSAFINIWMDWKMNTAIATSNLFWSSFDDSKNKHCPAFYDQMIAFDHSPACFCSRLFSSDWLSFSLLAPFGFSFRCPFLSFLPFSCICCQIKVSFVFALPPPLFLPISASDYARKYADARLQFPLLSDSIELPKYFFARKSISYFSRIAGIEINFD